MEMDIVKKKSASPEACAFFMVLLSLEFVAEQNSLCRLKYLAYLPFFAPDLMHLVWSIGLC